MRKKGVALLLCGAFMLTACSSDSIKANKNMVCFYSGEYEGHTYRYVVDINYDDESDAVEIGKFTQQHDNLSKEGQRGQRIVELMSRQSVLTDLEGIEVKSDQKGNSFSYEEVWKYNDIKIDEVKELDDIQKGWIVDDHYSANKIKEYYVSQEYSCDDNRELNKDLK